MRLINYNKYVFSKKLKLPILFADIFGYSSKVTLEDVDKFAKSM